MNRHGTYGLRVNLLFDLTFPAPIALHLGMHRIR